MKKSWLYVLISLVVLASVFVFCPAGVMADTYGDFTYTVSGSDATIIGYTGSGGDVTVPATIVDGGNTYNVTSIGDAAFWEISSLTSITMPGGLTSIGDWAFYYCTSLTSVTLPGSLTSIGYAAFNTCTSLSSVTLPGTLTSIGDYLFYNCTGLISVTLPANLTFLGNYMFYGCSSLPSIALPDDLTSVGNGTFSYCTSLSSITLPDGVTSIGEYVFYGCASLTTINLFDGITSIGYAAFFDCNSLPSITLPNGLISIGDWAFSYCTNLAYITLPSGLTSIGDYAFQYSSNLNTAYFFGAKPSLGWNVFNDTDPGFILYYHVSQSTSWSGYADYPSAPFCFLTLDNQEGSLLTSSIAVVDSEGHIAAPADPARPGYNFIGWYKEPACANIFDFDTEVVTDDVTLYAGWTAAGQAWYLDSTVGAGEYRVMEKNGAQNGSVPVEGTTELWLSNVPAGAGGVAFEDGIWHIYLDNSLTGTYSIEIGQSNGTHGDFTPFYSPITGTSTDPIDRSINLTGVSVPEGHYLALLVSTFTLGGAVNTDGSSYLETPSSTPSYPVPELAAWLLLALGLAGLGGVIIIRRKKLA